MKDLNEVFSKYDWKFKTDDGYTLLGKWNVYAPIYYAALYEEGKLDTLVALEIVFRFYDYAHQYDKVFVDLKAIINKPLDTKQYGMLRTQQADLVDDYINRLKLDGSELYVIFEPFANYLYYDNTTEEKQKQSTEDAIAFINQNQVMLDLYMTEKFETDSILDYDDKDEYETNRRIFGELAIMHDMLYMKSLNHTDFLFTLNHSCSEGYHLYRQGIEKLGITHELKDNFEKNMDFCLYLIWSAPTPDTTGHERLQQILEEIK